MNWWCEPAFSGRIPSKCLRKKFKTKKGYTNMEKTMVMKFILTYIKNVQT